MEVSYSGRERRQFIRETIPDKFFGRFSVYEEAKSKISFNVMPGKPVTEELKIKEYKLRPRYVEAIFDREYHSSMEQSPSHLIFLTALIHIQKMLYTYLCHELGIEYDPYGKEKIKIWPTVVNVRMPKLITKETDISHKLWITRLAKRSEHRLFINFTSKIDGSVTIDGTAMILKI